MKNFLAKGIQFLFSNPRFFIKFKDVALTNPAEHLYRTIGYIKKHSPDQPGQYIIDIGAARGDTCLYFSKHFPNLNILGFEPVLESYKTALQKTAGIKNIHIHHIALSDHTGTGNVHVLSDRLSSSLRPLHPAQNNQHRFKETGTESIGLTTLDSVYNEKATVLLIKIDTQGTELDVFKGAVETLKKTRFVLSEMNNHDLYSNTCQYHEIDSFLRSHHFKLKDIFVIYRDGGLKEYDSLYENTAL